MHPSRKTNLHVLICLLACVLCFGGRCEYDHPSAPLEFPADHAFHFCKAEWIYFSGVVKTSEGKEFGIMFTIFQFGVVPNIFSYPCMLAISDPDTKTYYAEQTSAVFNGECKFIDGNPVITSGTSQCRFLPSDKIQINSAIGKLAMDLDLESAKNVLLHGEDGIITMGDGNDSGYYSLTDLLPSGTLSINSQEYNITSGRVWMDHQWGNFNSSWDWFSIRFDDGGALMLFQFRDADNNVIGGNWTYRDGDDVVSYGTDFSVTANRTYVVENTSKSFPLDWDITIPSLNGKIKVTPLFDDQLINPTLWEGLCMANGSIGDSPLTGDAYVELQ